MWTKDKPSSEGWYFWKARRNTVDEFRFLTYYVLKEGDDFSYWSEGSDSLCPKGGWWIKNTTCFN